MCALLRDAPKYTQDVTTQWIKTPYGLKLADDPEKAFTTLMEQEKFVMAQDTNDDNKAYISQWIEELSSAAQQGVENRDNIGEGDLFYSKPNYTDTRVGGNDAINPYWQFNLDDDIVPPMLNLKKIEGINPTVGCMGRVYNEVYDSNQQILWLSMGVPEYANLISFYADAGNKNAAAAMNRGTLKGIIGTIINLVFKAAVTAITLPVLAPFWAAKWITRLASDRVTQYFYFRPAMVIYYELVNTMLSYLAVSMGLYPQVIVRRHDSTKVLTGQYAQMQFGIDPTATNVNSDSYGVDPEQQAAMKNANSALQSSKANADSSTTPTEQPTAALSEETTANISELEASGINSTAAASSVEFLSGGTREDAGGEESYADNNWNDSLSQTIGNEIAKGDSGIPDLLKYGVDIFSIINRRAMLFKAQRVSISTRQLLKMTMNSDQSMSDGKYFATPNDQYVVDKTNTVKKREEAAEEKGGWSKFWDSFKANMFGAGDFVGFRIERGVSCSENVSNSTGQLGIAQKLNSYAAEQREKYNNYGNSWIAKTVGELATNGSESFLKNLSIDLLGKAASAFGIGDIGAILTQGNGWIDIPEVWQGSSCDRSFTFNIQLNARYGDPVSIFQSIYIPMCLLLCAALPRAIGNSMYTSPFLVKAFCKGFFSIPCGLITSLSFTRGKDEFGWSVNMLPTSVSVSMTIKDLSPAFFLSMQDIGLFDTFTRNDKLMEYLDTLSALGIYERSFAFPKAARKLTAALLIKKNTLFNSNYWGMRLGKAPLTRALTYVLPFNNFEKSDAEFQAK